MSIIRIDASNIDREHICCAIGNDTQNRARAQLNETFLDGLVAAARGR